MIASEKAVVLAGGLAVLCGCGEHRYLVEGLTGTHDGGTDEGDSGTGDEATETGGGASGSGGTQSTGSATSGSDGDESCAQSCPAGEICVDGACRCRPSLVRCGDACANLLTDPRRCGSCDNDCGTQICDEGECKSSCGRDSCGEICTDLEEDPHNCGTCGRVCQDDELCLDGTCVPYGPACDSCPCSECEGQSCCDGILFERAVCVMESDCH